MGGLRTRRNTAIKVMLCLLLPPYILALEFKSREELSLMPQTLEEYLVDHEDTDTSSNSSSSSDDSSSSSSDSDSDSSESDDNLSRFERDSVFKPKKQKVHRRRRKMSLAVDDDVDHPDAAGEGRNGDRLRVGGPLERKGRKGSGDGPIALMTPMKTPSLTPSAVDEELYDTIKIMENGSLHPMSAPPPTTTTGAEDRKKFRSRISQLLKRKKKSSLKIGKKLYEFYTAPIAKFWSYTIAYLVMMIMFIYTAMVATPDR